MIRLALFFLINSSFSAEGLGVRADFLFPANTLVAGQGSLTVNSIGIDKCYDEGDLIIDNSECSHLSGTTTHLSPAGNRTTTNGDISYLESVALGGTNWITYDIICHNPDYSKSGLNCVLDIFVIEEWDYPANPLGIGDGQIQVSANQVLKCFNQTKGIVTSNSSCTSLLSTVPKKTYLSPAGSKNIQFTGYLEIDNMTTDGLFLIPFGEGENSSLISNKVLSERINATSVTCQTGYVVKEKYCSDDPYYFLRTAYAELTSNEVCSGMHVVSRQTKCFHTLTGAEVSLSYCTSLDDFDDEESMIFIPSPAGTREVIDAFGGLTTQKCEEGGVTWTLVSGANVQFQSVLTMDSSSKNLTEGLNEANGEIIAGSGWEEAFSSANNGNCSEVSSGGFIFQDKNITVTKVEYLDKNQNSCVGIPNSDDPNHIVVWENQGIVQEEFFPTENLICDLTNDCGISKNINYENREVDLIVPSNGENATRAGNTAVITYNYTSVNNTSRNGTNGIGGVSDLVSLNPVTRTCTYLRDASTDPRTSSFAKNPLLNYRVYSWSPIRQGNNGSNGNTVTGNNKAIIIKGLDSSMRYWAGRSGIFDD